MMNLGGMEERTAGMKKQAQELIEQAYNSGYAVGYAECEEELAKEAITEDEQEKWLEQGRNEAWEVAKKISLLPDDGGLSIPDIQTIFRVSHDGEVFESFSASEAIEKIREWEKEKKQEEVEIHVGDEIRVGEEYRNAFNAVVCMAGKRYDGIEVYQCISGSGLHVTYTSEDNVRKTGRHFPEIAEVLKKLGEIKNETEGDSQKIDF